MNNTPETSKKFFALARAYLLAAESLNDSARAAELDYKNAVGSAVKFNVRLAVELFLKGAIVLRDPSAKVIGHALEMHRDKYNQLFPEEEYRWDVPFTVQFIGGTDEERASAQARNLRERPLDQIFRYPIDNKGKAWDTLENYCPTEFAEPLRKMGEDISRLMDLMPINKVPLRAGLFSGELV